MHIAHLARAENELLASFLEDELRFVLREDMRGAIVLLRQFLLPLQHFAGQANDHVVLIGLSVDRDGAECGAFDFHGLTLIPSPSTRLSPHRCGRASSMSSVPPGCACFRRLPLGRAMPISDCVDAARGILMALFYRCHVQGLIGSNAIRRRREPCLLSSAWLLVRGKAGNCSTVACWPSHNRVSSTICPSGNSSAS